MKKSSRIIVLLLACTFVFLTACFGGNTPPPAPTPANGDGEPAAIDHNRVVNVAYTNIINSFDASTNVGIAETICYSQVYDSLLEKDLEGNLRPSLAKSWSLSDDGLVYTFHLQEGVKWSDGTDFTANDVKASFEYYASRPAYEWFYNGNIAEIHVVDELTVDVVLKAPNSAFTSYMGLPMYSAIMQKAAIDTYGTDIGSSIDKIVGTGAYVVTDWKNNVSVTYQAKEDYFKGPVDIKNLVIHQITDTNAAIVALQTGELDLYFAPITGTAYNTLSKQDNIKIEEFDSCRNEAYYMYTRSGLFSDVRMRQAVAYAISKEDVLTVVAEGMGTVIQYPGDIGPAMAGNPDIVPSITYNQDLEKAKALVKESGNEGAKVVIKSYSTEPYATMGTYLHSVLSEIGLDASVEQLERAAFIEQMKTEQVMILPFTWVGSTYDIDEVLGTSLHSKNVGEGANYSFYEDPEMDKMVEAARAAKDMAEREKIYTQIIEKFMADVPFVTAYAVKYAIPHSAEIVTDNPISYAMFNYKWAN